MVNKLLLADAYDLLPADPTRPAMYQLVYEQSLDRGFGVPDTETIKRILDGERVVGSHTSNRTITLPVLVIAADRSDLTFLVDQLLQVVASDAFTLEWTPDGGLPVVYECSRGTAEQPWNVARDDQTLSRLVTLTFQASPYGRSRDLQYIAVDAGSAAQIPLDEMDSGSWPLGGSAVALDTAHWQGTHSAKVTAFRDGPFGSAVSGKNETYVFPSVRRAMPGGPYDLTGYGSVGVRFRWPAPDGTWTVHVLIQLLSGGVGVGGAIRTIKVTGGDTRWRLIRIPLSEDWTIDSVDEYVVWVVAVDPLKVRHSRPAVSTAWFDDLRAYPPGSTENSTAEGAMLTVPGVLGSAPAPVQVAFTSDSPFTGILFHRPPGDQDPDLAILLGLGNVSNPSVTVAPDSARYFGTYAVVLLANTLGADGTVTVAATQTVDGTVRGTATTRPRPYTSADFDGKFLIVGNLTLPPMRVPDECVTSEITFDVTTSDGGTALWADLMLLDTFGRTILVGDLPTATKAFYIDVDPVTESSLPYASGSDRSAAFSVTDRSDIPGGPLTVDPGDNTVLMVCPEGVQDLLVSYFPRWLDERVR